MINPYYDHDHQFFKLKHDESGTVVNREDNGDEVAKDSMEWLQKTSLK